MKTYTVIDGRIELMSFVDNEQCARTTISAMLPEAVRADWDGQTVNVIDWRIDAERKTVRIEYQVGDSTYAPILDATLAVEQVTTPLAKPGRSKNWQWRAFSGCWQNTKTGERVSVW